MGCPFCAGLGFDTGSCRGAGAGLAGAAACGAGTLPLRTAQLLQSIASGDTAKTLEQFRSLWQDGKDPAALLDELSMLQRDLLMQAVAPHGGRELLSGGYDGETLQTLSGAFTPAQLLANLQSIQDALTAMAAQPNPKLKQKKRQDFTLPLIICLCKNNFLFHNLPRTSPYVIEASCPF